jgi:S-adenosylmethionine decarboxylase
VFERRAKMEHVEYGFGQHLMLDGYGCDRDKLVDLNGIYDFLSRYPDEIQMTKIMPPYVFKYSGKVPEDWGISGFVLIAESHISIHTFPDKLYLSLDIFSCKAFNANLAIRHIKDIFSIEKMEIKLLNRGHEFPRIIRSVQQFIKNERSQMRV